MLSPSAPVWPEGVGRIVKLFEKKAIKKIGNGGGRRAPEGSPMDVDLLQQIVKLMAANDLNTVDVRDGDRRIILKRGAAAPVMMSMPAMSAPMAGNPGGGSTSAPPPPVDEEAGLKP